MTITIKDERNKFNINAVRDMKQGHAYIDRDDNIYICNLFRGIAAFSLDGRYLIMEDSEMELAEVSLEVTVKWNSENT